MLPPGKLTGRRASAKHRHAASSRGELTGRKRRARTLYRHAAYAEGVAGSIPCHCVWRDAACPKKRAGWSQVSACKARSRERCSCRTCSLTASGSRSAPPAHSWPCLRRVHCMQQQQRRRERQSRAAQPRLRLARLCSDLCFFVFAAARHRQLTAPARSRYQPMLRPGPPPH